MAQRTVDVHNHYYPKDYLKHLLSRRGQRVRAEQTGITSYVVYCGNVIVAPTLTAQATTTLMRGSRTSTRLAWIRRL